MNFSSSILDVLGKGINAYFQAHNLRDSLAQPKLLRDFQAAESWSVTILEALSERAKREKKSWLAEQLSCHAADEHRHGKMFESCLKDSLKLNNNLDMKNLEDEQIQSTFFKSFLQGYSSEDIQPERIDWKLFLAATHVLESDSNKDLVRMANVLPDDNSHSHRVKTIILNIAKDEARHAAYLHSALCRYLPEIEVYRTIEEWRSRKAFATFTIVGDLCSGKISSWIQNSFNS